MTEQESGQGGEKYQNSAKELIKKERDASIFALAFATLSAGCVLLGAYYVNNFIIREGSVLNSPAFQGLNGTSPAYVRDSLIIISLFERYFPLVLLFIFAVVFTRASISFVRSIDYTKRGVVPPRDFDLINEAIRSGRSEPITEYIRLASLTGGVGIFHKVGLTGLPLAMIVLVFFFSIGTIMFVDEEKIFQAFLDLTKLTLGAFIGSFVQRQVERRAQETELQRAIQSTKDQTQKDKPPGH